MPHMEGIFINGEKAKFHPEDILDTDASQYTEEIGESVTAYLTEHITNPSNPPIDTSLSIAGAAADAKETGDELTQLKSELTTLAPKDDMLKSFPTDTASGSVASFADGANVPVKSLIVNIDPVQSGSGDPSPDNVRPISGWSEVNVRHSGADMTNPTVINIALGQTVYGGKLDVLSGELVIDMAMVDLGTLDWLYTADSALNMRASNDVGAAPVTDANATPNAICSSLPVLNYSTLITGVVGITVIFAQSSQAGKIWAHSDLTDASAFKTAMNGVQVCYELATPVTVQLTPHEVTALLGSNNIWADSGDSTVEYRADPTLYIGRLTEPDADMIADDNITSGQYFMVGNTLYKATANIASGGAITPNVNCTRKSLSEALNELNA